MARALAIPAGQDEVTPLAARPIHAANIAHRKSIYHVDRDRVFGSRFKQPGCPPIGSPEARFWLDINPGNALKRGTL
jgi:hypothetical protein